MAVRRRIIPGSKAREGDRRRPRPPRRPTLAVVVPVYNEAPTVERFHELLKGSLRRTSARAYILYINDGSTDGTEQALDALSAGDPKVRVLHLSRNFGQQAALTAGLDAVDTDAVIMMDGDGEHPPGLIPDMVEAFLEGHEVVLTRRSRDRRASRLKRWSASAFFRMINWLGSVPIEPEAADFRLLSRTALEAVRGMRERRRFLRGLVAWSGFNPVVLPYEQGERLGGVSKWSFWRLLGLAQDAILSFSAKPLLFSYFCGVGMVALAIAAGAWAIAEGSLGRVAQPTVLALGVSSLVLLVGGVLALLTGIVGSYLGQVSEEVRQRPIYVVRRTTGSTDGSGRNRPEEPKDAYVR